MLELFKELKGKPIINGIQYDTVSDAIEELTNKNFSGDIDLKIGQDETVEHKKETVKSEIILSPDTIYKIKVRQYLTKPPCAEFDFHTKYNNGIPMPLRIMVGKKLQETKGLVKMELWGEITEEITSVCMKCGRVLTNEVSKYFGIGPECGMHNYINPFDSDEELKKAVAKQNEKLMNIKWTGWVIKSAIEEEEILRND